MRINRAKFDIGHNLFKKHMLRNSEKKEPFVDFNHDFLKADEIDYKRKVLKEGRLALKTEKWDDWIGKTGKILSATRDACDCHVNLLGISGSRYGDEHRAEVPLYRVRNKNEIARLERGLFDFLKGGPPSVTSFGERFDGFCDYLKTNRLGCRWPFLAYLAFLLEPDLYMPLIPSFIDDLFRFYGFRKRISNDVKWENYEFVLNVADELKGLLLDYGELDSIEIQSYMWVVSYLVGDLSKADLDKEAKIDERLRKVRDDAERRSLIGWDGEEVVVKSEIRKLKKKRKTSLAKKVKHVSIERDDLGYDVLSFKPDGDEIHIEVKSTLCAEADDPGFWLSEPERLTAEKDPYWRLYRVYLIKPKPLIKDFGNIVLKPLSGWDKETVSWRFFKTD